MNDLVAWIQALFADCQDGAAHWLGWELDRAVPPLTATVTPANCSTAQIVLGRDDVAERVNFATHLQSFLEGELDRPVPSCPQHRTGLVAVHAGDVAEWQCREGDFRCRIGDYREVFWPPDPEDNWGRIAAMLSARLRRRSVTGVSSVGMRLRDGHWVASVGLRPEGDKTAVREAAAPVPVEIEPCEAVRTERLQRPADKTEPAHRALTLTGGLMRLAALRGQLVRADAGADYDFLVAGAPVRLGPEHRIGPPGGPLVLDGSGEPFAKEGDSVCCVGGFAPAGPVRTTTTTVFHAAELRVYEHGVEPRRSARRRP